MGTTYNSMLRIAFIMGFRGKNVLNNYIQLNNKIIWYCGRVLSMRLTSIAEGIEIKVNAYTEYDNIQFVTRTVQVLGDSLLVEPIKKDDEPINFKSQVVKIDLYLTIEGELPFVWKNVSVTYLSYMQEEYHAIKAHSEGFQFNRRKAYREFIGRDGKLQVGSKEKAYDVLVKDISSIGFAFIASEDMNIVRQLAHLEFQDKDGVSFNLHGQVVRKQHISENKIVYGCETTIQYGEIDIYIIKKQRERVQSKLKPVN